MAFVKQTAFLLIVLAAGFAFEAKAQSNVLVVADFDKGERITKLGEELGTWNGFPNDTTQGCEMKFVTEDALDKDHGRSVQLDYDADSANPAYNGFWVKIGNVDVSGLDTLSFYIKGDNAKGFTPKIKIELKDKKHGKANFLVENISDKWQKISLTLDPRSLDTDQKKPFDEFVVVFDDVNSRPKTGRILIDQIEFSASK
ncbi:MAG: hypothetical protein ABI999_01445 [Acidobacteriota bacterium]